MSSDAGLFKLVVFLLVDLRNVLPQKRSLIISNLACRTELCNRAVHKCDLRLLLGLFSNLLREFYSVSLVQHF